MTSKDTLRLTGFLLASFFVIGWVSINSCNAPAFGEVRTQPHHETLNTAIGQRIDGLIKTNYVCPDCGEWGCIYEQIDEWYDDGNDPNIVTVIYKVCDQRHITDSVTISLLKKNYNL